MSSFSVFLFSRRFFLCSSLAPSSLKKRKKAVASRGGKRAPSPALGPKTPKVPVVVMDGTYVAPEGAGQPSQPEAPKAGASERAATLAQSFLHQGEETMDLATFEAEARAKVKEEAFDSEGYLLPGYADEFVGVPPPASSSRHPTGSFVVRNGYVFRPKEVMDEGFSFLESLFDRYGREFHQWVDRSNHKVII